MDQTPPPQPRSPQPPSHDPYGNPYVAAYEQPAPASTPARSGWSWRATIAGAVAGGVLAASVAVPVTWALNRGETVSAASTPIQGAPQAPGDTQPETGSGSGELPDLGGGLPGGGYQTSPYGEGTSTQQGSQTDATSEQSQGVVLIDTETTAGAGAGTGLVIDPSGIVLTNYHVVEGSTSVQVTIATTGETYTAEVLGHDQASDIALLQLDGLDDSADLATVVLDDDGDPAVADEVTAIGNAQGQGYLSASTGTVTALDRSITTQSEGTVEGEDLSGLIQTDAYVVGGYSGGALLDDEGEVVGITTAASGGGASESYAIPITTAEQIAEQIESGTESGTVEVGPSAYLGVAIAESGGGVQVSQVQAGGAAATAGLTAGSTITGLGDASITSLDSLRAALATFQPGDTTTLRWTDSAGRSRSAQVQLDESPVN